jgi:hypothetical protein
VRRCASLFLKEIFVFSKNLSLMSEIARMFHRCKLRDYANYLKWKCKDHSSNEKMGSVLLRYNDVGCKSDLLFLSKPRPCAILLLIVMTPICISSLSTTCS